MSCCTYECNGGKNCPVRTTTITANAAQPQEQSRWEVIGVLLNGLFAIVLVAVVICLSGWIGYYLNFN